MAEKAADFLAIRSLGSSASLFGLGDRRPVAIPRRGLAARLARMVLLSHGRAGAEISGPGNDPSGPRRPRYP
jgi:hypothetical protein